MSAERGLCMMVVVMGSLLPVVSAGAQVKDRLPEALYHLVTEEKGRQDDGRALLFILNFNDFNCTPCLTNFLEFCDSLRLHRDEIGRRKIIFVFRKDTARNGAGEEQLARWLRKLRLGYPMHVLDGGFLEEHGLMPSCALLLEKGEIAFRSHLPFPVEERALILGEMTR